MYYYGYLSPSHQKLQEIRKQLGYFQRPTTADGAYLGHDTINALTGHIIRYPPNIQYDLPPVQGVTCIGIVPLIVNFNIRFDPVHQSKTIISQVTRSVRGEYVQALTLRHSDGAYEVACNLLQPKLVSTHAILEMVRQKAEELDLRVQCSYVTGLTEDELLKVDG